MLDILVFVGVLEPFLWRAKMKPRPKVGDHVKFQYRGERTGTVLAVAMTGVHFLIEWSSGRYKTIRRLIGINRIIEILPKIEPSLCQEQLICKEVNVCRNG